MQLFDRIGKTVSITQYGKDFVSYARDVVSALSLIHIFGFGKKSAAVSIAFK